MYRVFEDVVGGDRLRALTADDLWRSYNPNHDFVVDELRPRARLSAGRTLRDWLAENPPYGAVVTYHLTEGLQSLEQQRRKAEKKLREDGEPVPYPSWDDLRAEDREIDPELVLTIKDATGQVVRRLDGPTGKGFHRVAWDLRWPHTGPVRLAADGPRNPWDRAPQGPFAAPGAYEVTVVQRVGGQETVLAGPVSFTTRLLVRGSHPADDFAATVAFQHEAAELHRAVTGAGKALQDAETRLDHLRAAVDAAPRIERATLDEIDVLTARLADLRTDLDGDRTVSSRSEPACFRPRRADGSMVSSAARWRVAQRTPGSSS